MASKLYLILSTFFFLYTTLNPPIPVVGQECPYPCYPPPTGGGTGGSGGNTGNTPPTTIFPPPSQSGNFPPPSQSGNFRPPSSIFPYNPPNPNYYGDGPPPPDPIVPWFPYYYRKPPHKIDQPSSTGSRIQSTIAIFLIHLIVVSFLKLVY